MTKFNLFSSVTSKIFKTRDEKKNFEEVLKKISPNTVSIFNDEDKLEEIFLVQNIHKLKNKNFRKILLEGAFGTRRFNNYVSKLNIKPISKTDSDFKKNKFIDIISTFEWKNNSQTNAFIDSFNLDKGAIPSTKKEEDLIIIEKPKSTYFPMFDYQFQIFNEVEEKILIPGSRQIIRIPTGGGKTKIAMELVTNFFNSHENTIVVWLAETEELLEQAAKEFQKIWEHRGVKQIHLNRAWGNKNKVKPNIGNSKLIIGGLSKLINFLKENKFKADLIIFDEAHHAAANEYHKVIQKLSKGNTKIIGLTATPGRGTEDETEKLAKIFFNNKPIQIKTNNQFKSPIKILQEKGILSKTIFKTPIIIPQIKDNFSKEEINKILKSSEYNDKKLLMKFGQNHIRNIRIATKLLELAKNGKQVLYFGPTVEQSRMMYVLLINFGIKAGIVDTDTPKEYRAELISKFQKKEINFLLNFNVFVAGFDAPVVDTVFIGRPTKSPNTLLQMIGRGMRGPNVEGGTDTCDVYFVQDKILGPFQNFEKLYQEYDQYYEKEEFFVETDEDEENENI